MANIKLNSLEQAIFRTVLYADVFDFPLTISELHHFLIYDRPVTEDQITDMLAASDWLNRKLCAVNGYLTLHDRRGLVGRREKREVDSGHLWPRAIHYGRWLSRLPFVRMVALTGALAVRNAADANDDLDYLLVTTPNRVWLARAFAVLLVRWGRLWGVEVCPNYLLGETTLAQEQQDLYMAHEVVQIVPLYGNGLYNRFRDENQWVSTYLPNAIGPFYSENEHRLGMGWYFIKQLCEAALNGRVGDWFENWEYQRKLRRFSTQMQTDHSAAQVDQRRIKGHFKDHGFFVLQKYRQRLQQYGLLSEEELRG